MLLPTLVTSSNAEYNTNQKPLLLNHDISRSLHAAQCTLLCEAESCRCVLCWWSAVVEGEEEAEGAAEAFASLACSRAIFRLSLNESPPGERPSRGDWPDGEMAGESEGEMRGGMEEAAETNLM